METVTVALIKVADLRGWPVVGRTYVVPTTWTGAAFVPVFPDAHTDDEAPTPHLHVDPRFLTRRMEAELAANWRRFLKMLPKGQREPFMDSKLSKGLRIALNMGFTDPAQGAAGPAVHLKPMVCRYTTVQWDMLPRDHYWTKQYFPKAGPDPTLKAIRASDGRPLCPHHKFDLTVVWDGESDTVRCPLHGLKVDVSRCTPTASI